MVWAGFFFSSLFVGTLGLLAPLFYFDLIKAADGRPWGLNTALPLIIWFFILLPVFLACVFHLATRQKPIFFIRKEGIELRVIGTPAYSVVWGGKFGLLFLPIELYWRLLTGRMVPIQEFRMPWESIHAIDYNRGTLVIIVYIEDEGSRLIESPFSFSADAFGASTKTVYESLLYYDKETTERGSLPSWEQTGEIFEIV
jgi:hypothetical protein